MHRPSQKLDVPHRSRGTVAADDTPATFTVYESEIEGLDANITLSAANDIHVAAGPAEDDGAAGRLMIQDSRQRFDLLRGDHFIVGLLDLCNGPMFAFNSDALRVS